MKFCISIIIIILLFFGCKNNDYIHVILNDEFIGEDSITVKEVISERTIATLSPEITEFRIKLESPTIVIFSRKNESFFKSFKSIMIPGKEMILSLDTLDNISNDHLSDSLLNYIWRSNNEFINENSNQIWINSNPMEVYDLFMKYKEHRDSVIITHKERLDKIEIEALLFENSARVYSFLFYYGRIINKLDFDESFFSFINNIDVENYWNRSLPQLLLYKFEIEYSLNNTALHNLVDFLSYIESRIPNEDMSDFIKGIFIRDLIEIPSYWPKLHHLSTQEQIQQLVEKERDNKYHFLFKESLNSFLGAQKGKTAFNFRAENILGEEIHLSDYKGKYVLIDVWATWCAPCLENRPKFIDLATKYKGCDKIVFLNLSIDASNERWKSFVSQENVNNSIHELQIIDGMNTQFGINYLVTTVPKYILIDQKGLIVNVDLPKPSLGLESIIESILSN
jgi:thiol-disulfide isomerase/thioredoxin